MDLPKPRGRFPKSQRILKRSQFQTVQAGARRVVTPHFVLLIRAREADAGGTRFGVTASRKVGSAVVRNRAKRLAREAFRATRSLWSPRVDVVAIVRHLAPQMGLVQVTAEWLQARPAIERRTEQALSQQVLSAAQS